MISFFFPFELVHKTCSDCIFGGIMGDPDDFKILLADIKELGDYVEMLVYGTDMYRQSCESMFLQT